METEVIILISDAVNGCNDGGGGCCRPYRDCDGFRRLRRGNNLRVDACWPRVMFSGAVECGQLSDLDASRLLINDRLLRVAAVTCLKV